MTTRTFGPWEQYPGDTVTVTVSGVPMRWFFDFRARWYGPRRPTDEFLADVGAFAERAAPEWTRVHPAFGQAESFADLPLEVVRSVVNDWDDAVMEVPPPLPLGSSGGGPSAAPSTPAPGGRTRSRRSSTRRRSTTS